MCSIDRDRVFLRDDIGRSGEVRIGRLGAVRVQATKVAMIAKSGWEVTRLREHPASASASASPVRVHGRTKFCMSCTYQRGEGVKGAGHVTRQTFVRRAGGQEGSAGRWHEDHHGYEGGGKIE